MEHNLGYSRQTQQYQESWAAEVSVSTQRPAGQVWCNWFVSGLSFLSGFIQFFYSVASNFTYSVVYPIFQPAKQDANWWYCWLEQLYCYLIYLIHIKPGCVLNLIIVTEHEDITMHWRRCLSKDKFLKKHFVEKQRQSIKWCIIL